MRVRRAATYLVDPATGEERLVGNSEGAADLVAPEDDRPAVEIPAASPAPEEDEA